MKLKQVKKKIQTNNGFRASRPSSGDEVKGANPVTDPPSCSSYDCRFKNFNQVGFTEVLMGFAKFGNDIEVEIGKKSP